MDFKLPGYYTRPKPDGILITEKAERQKGKKEMLYRPVFAQIMNRFMEQRSSDRNIDQEQSFACKNETGKIDMRHLE